MTDKANQDELIAALFEELGELATDFRNAQGEPAEQQRLAKDALMTVIDFLLDLRRPRPDIEPLEALGWAMHGLVQGRNDDLLQNYLPNKGGQYLSPSQVFMQAHAVAWLELLVQNGMTRKRATAWIADTLAEVGGVRGTQSSSPVTKSTVREWKEKADSGDFPELREEVNRIRGSYAGLMTKAPKPADLKLEWLCAQVRSVISSHRFRDRARSAATRKNPTK